jgi:hypothetical protein
LPGAGTNGASLARFVSSVALPQQELAYGMGRQMLGRGLVAPVNADTFGRVLVPRIRVTDGSVKMTIGNKTVSRVSQAALASAVVLLAGCVAAPPPRPDYPPPPPDKPVTDLYAYPQNNQAPDQQERDRYECNNWAVRQTGFDPSGPNVPPHDRYRVVAAGPPPGSGTAVGAFTGAILGALIAGPRDAGAGLVGGAIAGGVLGTAAEQQQRADAEQQAENINDARDARAVAAMDARASNYRRALSACLEGRGYTVK